jgi:YihY family inner membrane protein
VSAVLDMLRRRVERWPWATAAIDTQKRFSEVKGGYLAAAITLAAFLSLFPLLLVAIAVVGAIAGERADLASTVISELSLRDEAARLVRRTLDTAQDSKRTASVLGLAGLLWSGLGLVATLQYAYNAVWQVLDRGIKDKLVGLGWLAGAGLIFAGSWALTNALRILPGFLAPIGILVAVAINVGLFLWSAKVLPNRDIGWRALVPGALLGGIGLEVLKALGSFYVPRVVAGSSALYGSIGVVFALLAWLFFFGRLIVYAATLNVVLWERGHGTTTIEVQVPTIPGRVALEGTRSGDVEKAAEAEPAPSA